MQPQRYTNKFGLPFSILVMIFLRKLAWEHQQEKEMNCLCEGVLKTEKKWRKGKRDRKNTREGENAGFGGWTPCPRSDIFGAKKMVYLAVVLCSQEIMLPHLRSLMISTYVLETISECGFPCQEMTEERKKLSRRNLVACRLLMHSQRPRPDNLLSDQN